MKPLMHRPRLVDLLPAAAVGLLAALGPEIAVGWWLDSVSRGAANEAVFFAVAAAVWIVSRRQKMARLAALWIGIQVELVAALFWMGAGTIWPLTITMGGALTAMAVACGGGAGHGLTRVISSR